MRKSYFQMEINNRELLVLSLFQSFLLCILGRVGKYGAIPAIVTLVVYSLIAEIINCLWFYVFRKVAIKFVKYIKEKKESFKRAGKQNAIQSEK